MFVRRERSVKEFIRFYPVVSILIILNIIIWALYHLLHTSLGETIYLYGIGQNLSVTFGEYWRIFTPIFLHGDFSHVAFNSFAMILFGPALEQMLGKFKFIIFYFLTGIIGNIATYIIDPHSTTLHLGASGAIYGLFGAYIFMIYFRKHLMDAESTQIIVVIFLLGLVMSFIQSNINIAAHVGGFIGGFAIIAPFLRSVERFSMAKNYRKIYKTEEDIQFNPQRWQKKRRPKRIQIPNFGVKLIWFIFILLAMIGFVTKYIFK